ncbi:hypothetical protein PHISCL_07689 [Aspergillus sclerotialis]|uniref:DUF2461 domain-containing protein n=1 Tax=Aspergillus sclerotialis TaxID=2070753 RepID=A0A3A2ZSD9_9EURO|nr:hypothetical protein PHISCL_07689 [Aspergillus sclerotialis]
MPRRSSRAVPAAATAPASASKRRASTRLSSAKSPPKKQKTTSSPPKAKAAKSTAKRSKYFNKESTEEFHSSLTDYESESQSCVSTKAVKGRKHGKLKSTGAKKASKNRVPSDLDTDAEQQLNKELWREGVTAGLGPGKEVIIKKPKMRDPGGVPYQDDTIHPNTKLFLEDLVKNNDRVWFKAHDPDYRAAKKDWETFIESLTERIIEQDSTIPELPVKDVVFRIHRDARFSKDPTPYKTHFAAAWSRTGRKGPYAAYYVHFEPGSCFVGSGLWMPEAEKLALIREEIDQNSDLLKTVLLNPDMRREIFGGIPDDVDAAVKAFVSQNKESALKTKPKSRYFPVTQTKSYHVSVIAQCEKDQEVFSLSACTGAFTRPSQRRYLLID